MGCNSSKGGDVSTGPQGQGETSPKETGNSGTQAVDTSNGKQADGFQNLEETQANDDHNDKHDKEPEVATQQKQEEQKTIEEPETKQEQVTEE